MAIDTPEAGTLSRPVRVAGFDSSEQVMTNASLVWNPLTLAWEKMTQPGAVGGGGDASAANQILQIAALGAPADVEASGNGSIIALLKRLRTLLAGGLPAALIGGRLSVDGSGVTQPVSAAALPLPAGASTEATLALIKAKTDNLDVLLSTRTKPADTQPVSGPLTDAQLRANPVPTNDSAAALHVTATAAVNTASTCTLPAPGAGLFHYITHIELVKLYSVIGIAAGAGVIVTSTNLPGNPAWTTEQLASAAGTATKVIQEDRTRPLKSSVANTATTFVAPLQLQTIWRWNVSYYTAP